MHGDTSESTPVPVRKRGRKTALITISDLDKRTGAAKRVGDLVRAIESDLGGRDHLSATQRQLVQRAAVLSAIAEDFEVRWAMGQEVDVGNHVTLINSLRRVYETIGLDRVARDVGFTIDDLAAEFAAERAVKEAAQAEAAKPKSSRRVQPRPCVRRPSPHRDTAPRSRNRSSALYGGRRMKRRQHPRPKRPPIRKPGPADPLDGILRTLGLIQKRRQPLHHRPGMAPGSVNGLPI
jgi:hypothetical protein